jgi:hypothetical protein
MKGWRSITWGTVKLCYAERSWAKLPYAARSPGRANLGLPLVAVPCFGPDK